MKNKHDEIDREFDRLWARYGVNEESRNAIEAARRKAHEAEDRAEANQVPGDAPKT